MLLSTVNPAAAEAIGKITKVGVGSRVVYHARAGMMRQGRTSFPADVLKQHPDDGSLDLYVIMEPEEIIMEQRVAFQSHNQPHHCWSVVQDVPGEAVSLSLATSGGMAPDGILQALVGALTERVAALEAKRGPGRPAKPRAAA